MSKEFSRATAETFADIFDDHKAGMFDPECVSFSFKQNSPFIIDLTEDKGHAKNDIF